MKRLVRGKKSGYESSAYWDTLLTELGLSMERGTNHHVSYMDDEGMQVAENKLHNTGRTLPKKTE